MTTHTFNFTTQQRQWLARCTRRAMGYYLNDNPRLATKIEDECYGIEWANPTRLTKPVIKALLKGSDEYGCDLISVTAFESPDDEEIDSDFIKFVKQQGFEKISEEVIHILKGAL